jgi:putative transposase
MARRKREVRPLDTIWAASDELWSEVASVLAELDPPAAVGRPRTDPRAALDGIIHHLRSGCQWNHLPRQFGDDSSVHRTFQRWVRLGVLARLWALLLKSCDELGGVDWQWQSADTAMGKARFGGPTSVPTPRIGPKTAPSGA